MHCPAARPPSPHLCCRTREDAVQAQEAADPGGAGKAGSASTFTGMCRNTPNEQIWNEILAMRAGRQHPATWFAVDTLDGLGCMLQH